MEALLLVVAMVAKAEEAAEPRSLEALRLEARLLGCCNPGFAFQIPYLRMLVVTQVRMPLQPRIS